MTTKTPGRFQTKRYQRSSDTPERIGMTVVACDDEEHSTRLMSRLLMYMPMAGT